MVCFSMDMAKFDFKPIKCKIFFFGELALLLVAIRIIGYAAFTLNTTVVSSCSRETSEYHRA